MVMKEAYTPPKKIAYPLKTDHFKRKRFFQTSIFRSFCCNFEGVYILKSSFLCLTVGSDPFFGAALVDCKTSKAAAQWRPPWDSMMNDDHLEGLQKLQSSWFFPNPFGQIRKLSEGLH